MPFNNVLPVSRDDFLFHLIVSCTNILQWRRFLRCLSTYSPCSLLCRGWSKQKSCSSRCEGGVQLIRGRGPTDQGAGIHLTRRLGPTEEGEVQLIRGRGVINQREGGRDVRPFKPRPNIV